LKTVAYLAAGKPIVLASRGGSADVVSKAGAGIVLPPDDPARLAAGLLEIAEKDPSERAQMGERGRHYFAAHFTKQAVLPAYIAALARVADTPSSTQNP
jgi:glycosyltransferase involved in cell wall biosynthesis